MKLIKEAKDDFELFHNHPDKYKNKVDKISELLKLKDQLKNDFLPTYFAGNYDDRNEKYV